MTLELWMLVGSVFLLFVLVMTQQLHTDVTVGVKYALSNREEPKSRAGLSGRIDRTIANHKENLLFFAPIVLILAAAGISTGVTRNGAILFLAARIAHALMYIFGLVPFRSVAWMLGIVGVGMMASALF